jgi:hypothetical protein
MPFIHKNQERFSLENEFRVIVQRFPHKDVDFNQKVFFDCDRDNPDIGLVLRVDLGTFINQIVIAPKASPAAKSQAFEIAQRSGFSDRIRESELEYR